MGGISKFQGSKGANQYEQYGIIRFELPFDGWCLGCGRHMSKGLRFNAKKDKAGKYFSTQIWAFSMKCYSCEQRFKILTDPENNTYNFAEGLRKHEQDYEPDFNDSIINPVTDEDRLLIANDPMFRLQHEEEDLKKFHSEKERFEVLSDIKESLYKKDYDMNSALRKAHRAQKKQDKEQLDAGRKIGLSIPLLPASETDYATSSSVIFKHGVTHRCKIAEKEKLTEIQSRPLFPSSGAGIQKRKSVESAMRKQSKLKLDHQSFKLSAVEPTRATLHTELRIKRKADSNAYPETTTDHPINAFSMLSEY